MLTAFCGVGIAGAGDARKPASHDSSLSIGVCAYFVLLRTSYSDVKRSARAWRLLGRSAKASTGAFGAYRVFRYRKTPYRRDSLVILPTIRIPARPHRVGAFLNKCARCYHVSMKSNETDRSARKHVPMSVRMMVPLALACAFGFGAIAFNRVSSIHQKVQKVQNQIQEIARFGIDPSSAIKHLSNAKRLFDAGDADGGENELDVALSVLNSLEAKKSMVQNSHDFPVEVKQKSNLFVRAERVTIDGFTDDCMEPCISKDGQYLYFNNSNRPEVHSQIHCAKRIDGLHFKYLGILPGTTSSSKDMALALNNRGTAFWTSLRSFETDRKSIYTGQMMNSGVQSALAIEGSITVVPESWINMDCDVSAGGEELFVSRAQFLPGAKDPIKSDIKISIRQNERYDVVPNSDLLLKQINTEDLEYAPCVCPSGLELLFTRTRVTPGEHGQPIVRSLILIAKRSSKSAPFGTPEAIVSATGFSEAPTISSDGAELFFHKLEPDGFKIYRARRQ